MTELQKEFEATGYTSWINSDIYPDGKIYTKEYTEWLEKMVLVLRQPDVIKSVCTCNVPQPERMRQSICAKCGYRIN